MLISLTQAVDPLEVVTFCVDSIPDVDPTSPFHVPQHNEIVHYFLPAVISNCRIYQSCCPCPGPCPQGVLKNKFKAMVLVLGAQVLVLVLVLDTQVLVLVPEEKSLVVSLFLVFFSWHLQSRFLRNLLPNTHYM